VKRIIALGLIVSMVSLGGFVGCSEKSKVEKKTTVTSPGGSTSTTSTIETEKKGENPPPSKP
jgi:hypothetical protein